MDVQHRVLCGQLLAGYDLQSGIVCGGLTSCCMCLRGANVGFHLDCYVFIRSSILGEVWWGQHRLGSSVVVGYGAHESIGERGWQWEVYPLQARGYGWPYAKSHKASGQATSTARSGSARSQSVGS